MITKRVSHEIVNNGVVTCSDIQDKKSAISCKFSIRTYLGTLVHLFDDDEEEEEEKK